MKKGLLLNAPLSAVIAECGHTDMLCVCDAGLPIPAGPRRIDLALHAGLPGLLDTTRTLLAEMVVEKAILACELPQVSPACHQAVLAMLEAAASQQGKPIAIEYITHEEFKQTSQDCKAIVRTGEVTPYANILLCAGVAF